MGSVLTQCVTEHSMKKELLKLMNGGATGVLVLAMLFGSTGVSFASSEEEHDNDPICSTVVLTSDAAAQTAGYTEVNPLAAPLALAATSYSAGAFVPAIATETVIPPWVDPATDSNFGTTTKWISTHTSWPGGAGNSEGAAANDQWRLFKATMTLPAARVLREP